MTRYNFHSPFCRKPCTLLILVAAWLLGTNVSLAGTAVTGRPLYKVNAIVSFSPTNPGLPINPSFGGLSYEKIVMTNHFFVSSNVPLVKLFSQIGPAVLRIGANAADTTCWGGISNKTPITASEVDRLVGFINALPTNWSVIYGINFAVNNPTNCADEATYVSKALGPRLLGFEIGNEPDTYQENGIRTKNYRFSNFVSQWQPLAAVITNEVPGWAMTNGGSGWTLTGPATAGPRGVGGCTVPFARREAGVISLLTQHYYRADGKFTNSTMQLLLQPDPRLSVMASRIVSAATAAHCALGTRIDECGSFFHGGAPHVSNAYGAALWSLDYMFTLAQYGCDGINFHGGGRSPYTPLFDRKNVVTAIGPEFYALKMFSLLPPGNALPARVKLSSKINFTAYGVRLANGSTSVLLNNKETNRTVVATINLGSNVVGAKLIELTGPSLNATNGYTLCGATINLDGSWDCGAQPFLRTKKGRLKVVVPPISAILLNPVTSPLKLHG
jgi:hypothetical protein